MATTPTPQPGNSAAELKTILDGAAAQPAIPQAPEPPAQPAAPGPEWGQMSANADGTFEVKLATGEVFKGTAGEVIAKQAEAQYNTKRWGQDWKQKFEGVQQAVQPQPQTPPENPEVVAARQWVMEQVAAGLGIDPQRFPQIVNQMYQTSQASAQAVAWADFNQSCPDYVDNEQNAAALVDYLPNEVIAQHRPPTAEDFRTAHALALYNKRYQAAPAPAQVQPGVRPPVMPSSGMGTQAPDMNPWTTPKDQLRQMMIDELRTK